MVVVAVVIAPSPGQPDLYVRITQDGDPVHYWVSARPSDWGRAFKVERPGHEHGHHVGYDCCLEENGQADSCTCPGNTYGGFCKHVDALRALDQAGLLPAADGYKPGHDSFIPF